MCWVLLSVILKWNLLFQCTGPFNFNLAVVSEMLTVTSYHFIPQVSLTLKIVSLFDIFHSLGVFHASRQKTAALVGVLLWKIPEMTNMGTGNKIITVHRDTFLLHSLHETLYVQVPDHKVSSGVQVEVGPGGRPVLHGVIVIFVNVFRQGV